MGAGGAGGGAASQIRGYQRDCFGYRTVPDASGCDIRNDVLRRDLDSVALHRDGCRVVTGVLTDPCSGTAMPFEIGTGAHHDGGVQIDHVVALANAWQTGARDWDADKRLRFGNDPLNLLAVAADENQDKGSAGAATP